VSFGRDLNFALLSTMSATDYHSWSKFDEDAALQQSEEEEMHAEALRAQKRAELAKAELEAKVLRDSGQAAAALKSKSDVETLKAKQAGKRRGRGSPADAAANAAEAEKLRLLAEATARINECMQRGITLRSEAAKLTRAKRWSEAFDAALAALALLSEARGRIGADSGHATPFAQESHMCNGAGGSCSHHGDRESGNGHAHNGPCGGSHGHSHDHSHVESCHGPECGHGGTGASASSTSSSPPPAAAAAAASDVRNVLRVAHGDCGVIMGVCAASEGRLGEAADLLRAVLLEQPRRVDAWVARGEVFARMGVPLLADLHAQQAASLDDARPADAALTWLLSPGEAMEKLPRPPSALPPVPLLLPSSGVIAGADGGGGSSGDDGVQEGAALSGHVGENVDGAASAPAASSATLQAAREAAEFYRQGVALHREQCFLSARAKFEAALCLAEEASATSGADGAAAAPATIGGAAAPADDGLATDAATTSAAAAADPAADPAAAAAGAATAAAAATDP
ncbi:unnamed protein product, partial [Phaeothamnion confervicola]